MTLFFCAVALTVPGEGDSELKPTTEFDPLGPRTDDLADKVILPVPERSMRTEGRLLDSIPSARGPTINIGVFKPG